MTENEFIYKVANLFGKNRGNLTYKEEKALSDVYNDVEDSGYSRGYEKGFSSGLEAAIEE